jgi:hypothetical protein
MALTEKQLQERRRGIGASDAITIMWGTAEDWRKLRAEKVDDVRPVFDERRQLLMDMGNAIEPLTLREFDRKHHRLRKLPPEYSVRWKVDPFFAFTPDGITAETGLPVQCKYHTGDKDIISLADYYGPQLLHEMIVMGVPKCYLAVIFGHYGRFQHLEVEYDGEAADAYLQRAMAFKEYMATGEEPGWMAAPVGVAIPRRRDHVWEIGDNAIAPLCRDILETHEAKDRFAAALEELKELVPNDCATAKWVGADGRGILIKVARNESKRWSIVEAAKTEPERATVKLGRKQKIDAAV